MPTARTYSFTVEPLEARVLLSAAPADAVAFEASEPSLNVDTAVWQDSENEEEAAGALEEEGLFEDGAADTLNKVEFSAFATTAYGDGETADLAIFQSGFTVIESGATHTFRATTGGIFFSGPGTLDGTSPADTHENVHLIAQTQISIEGPIGGTSPIHDLVVSAGSNVFFGGSINLTGDLIIEAGAQVTFSRDVTVQGDIIIGDSANPSAVAGVAFGEQSLVNVGGEMRIHTSGTVDFRNRVGVSTEPTAVTVTAGEAINVEQDFFAARIDFSAENVTFDRVLRVSGEDPEGTALQLTAEDLLSFGGRVEIGEGDAILTANRVSFTGGDGSVQSVGTESSLTIRPFDTSRGIGIGEPTGGDFSRLQITDGELNAIHSGFEEIVIGDLTAGTGEVRLGNIGLAQPTGIAQIQNAVTFVGGSVVVEGTVDIDKGAEYLRLIARTGDILVNGAINQSATERNAWVRFEAEGDIVVNRPVFALDRISLTAGYTGGEGSVFVESTGTASGQLFTTNGSDTFTARRIEIVAGATRGDILFTGDAGDVTLSVAGDAGSIAMHAAGGSLSHGAGLIRGGTLSLLARDDISISIADVQVLGETTIAGEVLASGVDQTIRGVEITGTGSFDLTALNDLVIDWIATSGGNIAVDTVAASGDNLEVGEISAGGGAIELTADGAILDSLAGLNLVNLTTTGAATLLAASGIGGPGILDIDTDVGSLSARNTKTGDIFIANRSALSIIGHLETLGGDGAISVTTNTGDLSVNAPVAANGSGNLHLRAATAALVINSAVGSSTGHVTLIANGNLQFLANASAATSGEGTMLLRAENGAVEMDATALASASDANLRMEAGDDVVLGTVAAQRVAIVSDAGSIVSAGAVETNVTATELRLEAGGAIGQATAPLSVAVDRIAASADGVGTSGKGIYLSQSGAVAVATVDPVEVQLFAADGSLTARADSAALAGFSTGNSGNIILISGNGSVSVESSVIAADAGSIRIEAAGSESDLLISADLVSGSGHVTVVSAADLILAVDAGIITGNAGTILARANGGALVMDASSRIVAIGSAAKLLAATSVTLGQVEAEAVSVVAEDGSILSALESTMNLNATKVRLNAEQAIGTAVQWILTSATLISASARGNSETEKGVYLLIPNSTVIGTVGFAGFEMVADGSVTPLTDADQSGILAEAGGEVRLDVDGGLELADGSSVVSDSGDIILAATGDLRVSTVASASGDILLWSGGAILDNSASEEANLSTVATVHLFAANGIGGTGAADLNTEVGQLTALNTTIGLIVIREADGLELSAAARITSGGVRNEAANGSVLIATTAGHLVASAPVYAGGGGKILLAAEGTGADLSVSADITAVSGAISLLATRHAVIDAAVRAEQGGTIDLRAVEGDLLLSPNATVQTLNAAIRLAAGQNIDLTGVDAGLADVSVSAWGGSISDGGNVHERDLVAGKLRLFAAGDIGAGDALDIKVATLAAEVLDGSVFVSEANGIAVGTVPVVIVDRVNFDDTTTPVADAAATSDLVAQGAGQISLISEGGAIIINDGVLADGFGVRSSGGSLVLQAASNFVQNASIATTAGGDITVRSVARGLTMADGTQATTESGQIHYAADDDLRLSQLISRSGTIRIEVGQRIVDATDAETANVTTGGHAILSAGDGIGDVGVEDINTNVGSLEAGNAAAGRIVLNETNGLVISGSGVVNAGIGGDVILSVQAGQLRVDAPVAAAGDGDILLQATGLLADIASGGAISSEAGHITILAPGSIRFEAGATVATAGAGTIIVDAANGEVAMDGTARIAAVDGDIQLTAATDVSLGAIQTLGNVAITAVTGSIYNNGADAANLIANGLRLSAAIGIGRLGAAADPVTTHVDVLTARATSGGIHLVAQTSMEIADVAVTTQQVNADGSFTAKAVGAQSDIATTGGNGSIVLTVDSPQVEITLRDGTERADGVAIGAHGSGNILIDGGTIIFSANSDIRSTTGNLSLRTSGSILFGEGADLLTNGGATINVEGGQLVMDATTRFATDAGDIRVAATSVQLGSISTFGNVAILARDGSILDTGDAQPDISARSLILNAGNGVGSLGAGTTNAIETDVQILSARGGAGGIAILNAEDLTVGDVTVTVADVTIGGGTVALTTGAQSDVRTISGDGSIVIRLTEGSLVLEDGTALDDDIAVAAHGAGNIYLETLSVFTDMTLNGGIRSDAGNVSLASNLEIQMAPGVSIEAGGSGTIDIVSRYGFILMEDTSLLISESGDIRLHAASDILLGGIRTGGNVSLISTLASILDNGDAHADVEANGLRLQANTDIGILVPVGVDGGPNALEISASVLTAHAAVGDINLMETDGLIVDDVSVTVNRVGSDGATITIADATQSDVRTKGGNSSIILRSVAGDLEFNDGTVLADGTLGTDNIAVSAHGSGLILLETLGEEANILARAGIESTIGHITILAAGTAEFQDGVTVATGGNGSLFISGTDGDVLQGESRFSAFGGSIRLVAGDSIVLGELFTTSNISLIAETGSILAADLGTDSRHVIADRLRMVAGIGIGEGSQHIETRVNTVSARAASGGIFILEADVLVVGDARASVERVNPDNTLTTITDATQSDIATTGGDGSIVIRTLAGDLILQDGSAAANNLSVSAHGEGNVLLQTLESGADLLVQAGVQSGAGNITLIAEGNLTFSPSADVRTSGTGSIYVGVGGTVEMDDLTLIRAFDGNISIFAEIDVILGGILTNGSVAITALTGSIMDGGDSREEVTANGLILTAGNGIGILGVAADSIEIDVTVLAARANAGEINILEASDLVIDEIAFLFDGVLSDGSVLTGGAVSSDVVTGANGSIVIRTLDGAVELNEGSRREGSVLAHGSGNVLIEAKGETADITVNANVESATGSISLSADRSVIFGAAGGIVTGGTGTIAVTAESGEVNQADGSRIVAEEGDIAIRAATDIYLGAIQTGGDVAVVAEAGAIFDSGDATEMENVAANSLLLSAATGIGTGSNALETAVGTLSAVSGTGGLFVLETDALVLGTVEVSVGEVQPDGTLVPGTTYSQANVSMGGSSPIVVRTLIGDLTFDAAIPAGTPAVEATGAGNLLLQTLGAGTNLLLNADVRSGGGHVTLLAGGAVTFVNDADVTTTGEGTINIEAAGGGVELAWQSLVSTDSGDIRVYAETDVYLGGIVTTGDVSITAVTGSIRGVASWYVGVVATGLRMMAGVNIGWFVDDVYSFDVTVETLTAIAETGGIAIRETDGVTVGDVEVTVQRVLADGTLAATTDALQSDLRTTAGDDGIFLQAQAGDIVLNDGTATADGVAISAAGAGNVAVKTAFEAGNVFANADIISETGHITVEAHKTATFGVAGSIGTSGEGTIRVEAGEDITQHDGSRFSAGKGDISLSAEVDIWLGQVSTGGSVVLIASTGSIFDNGDVGGEDVVADQLQVRANIGFGEAANAVETRVGTLSVRASSGGVFLLNSGDLVIADTSASVERVLFHGALATIGFPIDSDVATTLSGDIVIRTVDGSVTLNDGIVSPNAVAVSAEESGNILIEAGGIGSDIDVNGGIRSGSGHITLLAGGTVRVAADASVSTGTSGEGSGTLFIEATSGSVVMADGAFIGGNEAGIRIFAGQDILLGAIETSGNVSLMALDGAILDNGDAATDITASGLSLTAGTGIGTLGEDANALDISVDTLTARAGLKGAGDVNIRNDRDLVLDAVEVTVERVGEDGATTTVVFAAPAGVSSFAGSVILRTPLTLTVNGGAVANGVFASRDILLEAGGIVLNSRIVSGTGHVTILSTTSVWLNAGSGITAFGPGSIFVEAAAGSIEMDDNSLVNGGTGNIRLWAAGDILLGGVRTTADVSIIAVAGSIRSSGNQYIDVQAGALRLEAGNKIGDTVHNNTPNPLEVDTVPVRTIVKTVTARAGGFVRLLEFDALVVDDVEVSVMQVNPDGSTLVVTDEAQADVRTDLVGGKILIQTANGDLTLKRGTASPDGVTVSAGSGDILLEAGGAGSTLTINGNVHSSEGYITIVAAGSVRLGEDTFVFTGVGTVSVEGKTGSIVMADASRIEAVRDISLSAEQDIVLGGIKTPANVSIVASSGSILDGGDTYMDIEATRLRMGAGVGIGTLGDAADAIETAVSVFAARSGSGGINLVNTKGFLIDETSVYVAVVDLNESVRGWRVVGALWFEGIETTDGNGSIVLRALEGEITVGGEALAPETNGITAHGSGNILLEALGAGGSVVLTADSHVRSGSGHITVRAANDVTFSTGARIATGGAGTMALNAASGSVSMAEASRVEAVDGDIRLLASEDILLAEILTGGNVSLTATLGSILSSTDAPVNLVADGLRMVAGGSIGLLGENVRPIGTTVTTLSARAGLGGISILETDSLVVDDVTELVQTVNVFGLLTTTLNAVQSDVRTISGDGSIVIRTLGGGIVLNDGLGTADGIAVSANGAGNILIQAEAPAAPITINAGIESGTGHITVEAVSGLTGGEIVVGSDLATGGSGTISISGDMVRQLPGTRISAGMGDIMLVGTTGLHVAGVVTGGNVALTSESGAVLVSEVSSDENIIADQLVISAAGGVGTGDSALRTRVTTLAIRSESGGVYVSETDGLIVDRADATIQRVLADGTVIVDRADERYAVQTLGGNIVIRSLEGDIILMENRSIVSVDAAGNILIEAIGVEGRIRVLGFVHSDAGHVTLLAGGDIAIDGGLSTSGTGTILVEASAGSIQVSSFIEAGAGDVRLRADQHIVVGDVRTDGDISITAVAGSIVGAKNHSVSASGLRLMAGVSVGSFGTEASPLETEVGVLTARSGAGGINILNSGNVTIGTVAVTIQKVNAAGSVELIEHTAQSGVVTTAGDGAIVIRSEAGGIDVDTAIAAGGNGNVLVATADGAALNVNADIQSGSGHITLISGGALVVDGATVGTVDGTINLEASGSVVLTDGNQLTGGSGNIRIVAVEDVFVEVIATTGNVSITSITGSILPGENNSSFFWAESLRLSASVGIGTPEAGARGLRMQITTISAHAGDGGVNIFNNGDLRIDTVEVGVERVNAAGGTTTVTDAAQSDVRTTGEGSILLKTVSGDLILNDGSNPADGFAVVAEGTGNIRLTATARTGHAVLNAGVSASAGNVEILALEDVSFAAGVSVRTGAEGTISILAFESILLSGTARVEAESGNIRLEAGNDIQLGAVETAGSVSLIATNGSILSNAESGPDVVADGLRMVAGIGVGTLGEGATPLETSVNTISARATSGGINILETDGLVVDDVAVTVSIINSDGTLGVVTDAIQSDVRTTAGNGSIVIRTLAGPIVLNDGTAPEDGTAIFAHGSGNILIEALGEGGDIEINANVTTLEGVMSIRGTGSLSFGGNVTLTSGGADGMHFEVGNGSLTFGDGVLLDAGDGDIRLVAEVDVLLGGVRTTGNVSIIAVTGSILDNGDTYTDVVASGLRLVAGTGIGTLGEGANALDTDVTTVSARAGSGGINLYNIGALTIDAVEVTVSGVGADGNVIAITDEAQSDLVTTANGSIVVRTESGSLRINDGVGPADGVGVSANGGGNVLLSAGGEESDLDANASILSGGGYITLLSGRSVTVSSGVEVSTAQTATVYLESIGGGIILTNTSRIEAGMIRLWAEKDILLGHLSATDVALKTTTGSILDRGDSAVDVVAQRLLLEAAIGIGTLGAAADSIETDVDVLTAHSGAGGINILEASGITISHLVFEPMRVAPDGALVETEKLDSGYRMTTEGNGSITLRTLSGGIDIGSERENIIIQANGTGNIFIETTEVLTVSRGIRSDSGNITLLTGAIASEDGYIFTDGGDISVEAKDGSISWMSRNGITARSGNVQLHAEVSLFLGTVATSGDVSMIARTGGIWQDAEEELMAPHRRRMEAQGDIIVSGANLFVLSAHSRTGNIEIHGSLNVIIGAVEVGVERVTPDSSLVTVTDGSQAGIVATGDVILTALIGFIRDEENTAIDIVANSLQMTAKTGIGMFGDTGALETRVEILSATTLTGVVHIVEADGLMVGSVDPLIPNLNADRLVLRTLEGDLVVTEDLPISVVGDILLEAGGAERNLVIHGSVEAQEGHVSLIATGSVRISPKARVATSGDGTLNIEAGSGSIVMGERSKLASGTGDIRLIAAVDVVLGRVRTEGDVSIAATAGSILDGDGSLLNIRADGLRLIAGIGIGTLGEGANPVGVLVATVSARAAGGGINLLQTDPTDDYTNGVTPRGEGTAIRIGDIGVTIQKVTTIGELMTVTEAVQSDVRTTGGDGSIVLRTDAGDLILNDGSGAADGVAVSANGGGRILLASERLGNAIHVNATVQSGSGEITVRDGLGGVVLNEDAKIRSGGGDISISGGQVAMADSSLVDAGAGNIRVHSLGDIRLGGLLTSGNVSITTLVGFIVSSGETYLDVVAGGLRLAAGSGIGTLWNEVQPLHTNISTLSATTGFGGIHILNEAALTLGAVTVAVERVSVDGGVILESDSQAGVTTAGNGAVAIRANGDLVLAAVADSGAAIRVEGSGNVLLEALEEGSQIFINADVRSGYGHVTLLAPGAISFGEGADVVSGGFGTIFVESAGGSIAMAETSRMLAGGGDIRMRAREELLLSSLQTTGNIFIRAIRGSILDQGDSHIDLAANGLFIIAGNGIGSAENPLEVAISRLSASAKGGGVALVSESGFRVGAVAVTVQRVNPSSSITPVTEEGTGVDTISGDGSILLRATAGHIIVDSAIVGDGSGSVTLGTDLVGGILLRAPVQSDSGELQLDSAGWIRYSINDGGPALETTGSLHLRAQNGIGETGSGALFVRSGELTVEIVGDGSAYLRTDASLVLAEISLAGEGSLDLSQMAGDLTVAGPISIESGHATILGRGAILLAGATVTVGGDIDMLAASFDFAGTETTSLGGSIRLRGAEFIEFDATSRLLAEAGEIRLRSGGDLVIGHAVAGGLLELIAGGSISSALPGDPAGVLVAGHLRMRAGEDVGAPEAPIYFDAGRLDVDAGGTVSIYSLGKMVIGRFGLTMESGPDEEIVIWVEDGEIGAVGGRLVDRGSGTLVVKSDNEIEVNSVVVSENGSIRVEANTITSDSTSDEGRIEARNGSVTFVAEEGIGGNGSGAVNFHSPKVQATTESGPLNLNSVGSTTVFGSGLTTRGGAGSLRLNLESGDLELLADVRHLGTGSVSLEAMLGAITMDFDARVSTTTGGLSLAARDDIRLSRLQTASGLVELTSALESIFGMTGLAGSAGANIVVTDLAPAPILNVANRAFLGVLADMVTVNGFDFYRSGRPTIPVNLTFL